MRVILHLVRHAQGTHNLSWDNEHIQDPDLTPLGRQQCEALSESFPHHDRLALLVASPLRRTLETCLRSFHRPGMPKIIAVPELQEIGASPCDIGSDVDVLQAEYGERVDLSRVMTGWREKGPGTRWEPRQTKLEARAAEARRALREMGRAKAAEAAGEEAAVHIVAVCHGGILHFLTGDWHGIPENNATGWLNTEYRSYEFVDLEGDDAQAVIKETAECWERRHGEKRRPSTEEMAELQRVKTRELAPWLGFSLD